MEECALSIAARCPESGEIGVVVASSSPAVGAFTPFIKKGAGILCTPGWFNPDICSKVADYLQSGLTANVILNKLLFEHEGRNKQFSILDYYGNGAAYSNDLDSISNEYVVGQQSVIQSTGFGDYAMLQDIAERFNKTPGTLGDRLINAVKDGVHQESPVHPLLSSVMIVQKDEVFPYLDLRVDQHKDPISQLFEIYCSSKAFFNNRYKARLEEQEQTRN